MKDPTLISRSPDNLDEKFEVLTSHDDIDALTAYGMVKTAPTILGYDVMRTKRQLDLLEQNGIIDAAISRPTILMNSPALMHALIEYAKERNGTSDLTDIRRTNIFMSNSTLKRLYGVTSDELKARYPYEVQEHDQDYIISGKDLGKTRPHISKTLEADQVVSDAVYRSTFR